MIALEDVQPGDWEAVRAAVDALRSLVLDTGGGSIGIRFGVTTFNWPGGTAQKVTTGIAHGLPTTPLIVFAVNSNNNTRGMPRTYTYSATTFTLDILTSDNSVPAAATSDTYRWVAIG